VIHKQMGLYQLLFVFHSQVMRRIMTMSFAIRAKDIKRFFEMSVSRKRGLRSIIWPVYRCHI